MHAEARRFVAAHSGTYPHVVELGGRDVNGGVRDLFDYDRWLSIDLHPGPAVDVVADARTYRPNFEADLVVCCEVAEHCPRPWQLVANAHRILRPGGVFLFTAACPPRAPHSAVDGGPVRDEHYRNIDPYRLASWLGRFDDWTTHTHSDRGDVYAVARR